MNRERRFFFCLCIAGMLILTAAAVVPAAAVTVHKWEDHTRPFTTRLTGITLQTPEVILLTLPAAVVATKQVALSFSATAYGSHSAYSTRLALRVNEAPMPALTVGPGMRAELERKFLKPGANIIRFYSTSDTTKIDVFELRVELTDAAPGRDAGTPVASVRPAPADRATPPERAAESPGTPRVDAQPPAAAPPPTPAAPPAPAISPKPDAAAAPPPAPAAVKAEEPKQAVATAPPAAPPRAPVQPERDPGQRWAVVVGVSEYEDSQIPSLRYAARDAQVFHDWLVAPTGGRYAPSKVKLLLNRNATNEKIKDALFNWLKQAIEEDVVVIYFAGHGSPESPESVQNLFLLPYNARYDNIAVTGFPMWDVETALKRFIKAKRVVIIADACHAAGVGQSFDVAVRADRGLQINQISSGLQGLSDVGEGVCVISASRDREFSQEGREWGGGHGVFSYYLLEGLKGAADFDRNGSVSVGEVTVYVSQQVRRATRNAQNPIVAGRFDPSLVIGK
jgi:uncharacterized caspase-like protein